MIDLYCSECPLTTKNFLKLCKIKFYNNCLFYNVQQNFIAQTGDPTGTGTGGTSVYGIMYGPQATSFEDEIRKNRKHNKVGLVSMSGNEGSRSQFFITLRGEDLEHLDGKHTIFGEVATVVATCTVGTRHQIFKTGKCNKTADRDPYHSYCSNRKYVVKIDPITYNKSLVINVFLQGGYAILNIALKIYKASACTKTDFIRAE